MDRYISKTPRLETSNFNEEDQILIENEPSTSGQSYKTKRKFRSEWLQQFDWLEEKGGNCFCIVCSKIVFNHYTHLKNHEKTNFHLNNYDAKKNQIKLTKYVNIKKTKIQEQVWQAELTLVMFCITHNLPFLLMDYLPSLVAECCPDSQIAGLLKCGRTKATQVTEFIAKKAQEKTFAALRAKKFSLIVDETTDVSTKKCLVLVARFVDSAKIVHDRFLALLELSKTDAISIYNVIMNFFGSNNIPIKNLIGLATDGANVMAGNIGGLKTLLNSETEIFFIKCSCHSLHLCSSYACKKLPNDIEQLCRGIYNFFSHSPKRITEFNEFQDYCSVKPHKILGICSTRWLSLEGVISRIIEQWDSLRLYFISCSLEVNGIRSAELANSMGTKIKTYFLFLSYILPIINELNKEFQAESSRLPYLYTNIKSNFLLIMSNFLNKSESLDVNFLDKNNHVDINTVFVGTKAEVYLENNLDQEDIVEIKSNILQFYIEYLNQIKIRFDFGRDDLKLLQIITPRNVLSKEKINILPLIMKFKNLVDCDPDIIVMQWNLLRLSDISLDITLSINEFWDNVSTFKNGLNEFCFGELCNFIFNLLSLPHSSAAAERKFSQLTLIKTKLRNKLDESTINNIMICKEVTCKSEPHYVWSAKKDL